MLEDYTPDSTYDELVESSSGSGGGGPSDSECRSLGAQGLCPMACWWCDDLRLCVAMWHECVDEDHRGAPGGDGAGATPLLVVGLLLCVCGACALRAARRGCWPVGSPASRARLNRSSGAAPSDHFGPLWTVGPPDALASLGIGGGGGGGGGEGDWEGESTAYLHESPTPARAERAAASYGSWAGESTCLSRVHGGATASSSQPEGQHLLCHEL